MLIEDLRGSGSLKVGDMIKLHDEPNSERLSLLIVEGIDEYLLIDVEKSEVWNGYSKLEDIIINGYLNDDYPYKIIEIVPGQRLKLQIT